MALLPRYLIPRLHLRGLLLFLFAAGFGLAAHAQPSRPPATFRTLALGPTVSGLFYDCRGQAVPVTAGGSGFSAPLAVPPDGRVSLYRQLPPATPEGKPRRLTVAEVQLGEGPAHLLFLRAASGGPTARIQAEVVADDWSVHPTRTMRVFNFSQRRALLKLGESTSELPPGKSHLFSVPSGNQSWLQAAFLEETGEWMLRASGPQVTLPRSRSTIVLLDQKPRRNEPDTREIIVRNLIDPEPPVPTG